MFMRYAGNLAGPAKPRGPDATASNALVEKSAKSNGKREAKMFSAPAIFDSRYSRYYKGRTALAACVAAGALLAGLA